MSDSQLVPEKFDYAKALRLMTRHRSASSAVQRQLKIERKRFANIKYGRSTPKGDEVLAVINLAFKRLDDEQFKECAGWE